MNRDAVTVSIEVAVAPDVAFRVFTTEIDAWYTVDAETLPDITRTAAIQFEPYVGGRLLDVQDLATGEGREMGRVTAWDPARRLAFVDNAGTEVEVQFETRRGGARVTLTHRGLDRLSSPRAAQRRETGWGALMPRFRDHLARNAPTVGLAVGTVALTFAAGLALLFALDPGRNSLLAWLVSIGLVLAAVAIMSGGERLQRRWLPSAYWQYDRAVNRVLAVVVLGLVAWAVYRATREGWDALSGMGASLVVLLVLWLIEEEGPARGQARRSGAARDHGTSAVRSKARLVLLLLGAVVGGLALSQVDAVVGEAAFRWLGDVAMGAVAVFCLLRIRSERRRKRRLGFHPGLFLGVSRRVNDDDRRPQVLFRQSGKPPEHSGWYALSTDSTEERSSGFVRWSLQELIDRFPEATGPLREGNGYWLWDQDETGYSRMALPGYGGTDGPSPGIA